MKYTQLGSTGLEVSELCFGVLPMGPLQADISVDQGGELLLEAMRRGINFFDTAQMYGTYGHLRYALDRYEQPERIIITSKSTAAGYDDMDAAVRQALYELGRDHIDVFLLHAARAGVELMEKRAGAWQCLLDHKSRGTLRAVGVSTHSVPVVRMLAAVPEVDVIFPLLNYRSLGILGGDAEAMQAATEEAAQRGKGLYTMKLLGGGALLDDILAAFRYGRSLRQFAAHAVGMNYRGELEFNLRLFNDQPIDESALKDIKRSKHWVLMEILCASCGACIDGCPSQALSWNDSGSLPLVDDSKCILCGYCAPRCPEFAIRVK
ncbi:MAG: aldo/keto reductase [Bacillota bacterium]|nr:aldo/keto reductase [Bacillota bacterium]